MVDRGLWATSLPDCSFRGAPFHFSEDAGDGGRRAMVHKVPGAETWLVEDLGSTNGTFVDGVQIFGTIQLTDRQEFTCGKSTFMLLIRKEDSLNLD